MNKVQITSWLIRLAWGILGLNTSLIFLIPTEVDSNGILILMILYFLWLIGSSSLAVTWLIVCYRSLFYNWWALGIPFLFLLPGTLSIQNVITPVTGNLSFFLSVLFLVSFWSMGVVTATYLWKNDTGLSMVAWWLVIIIWSLTFAWRFQGNLIELWAAPLKTPEQPAVMWWFVPLQCFSCWLMPLGILSFFWHTGRLFVKEFSLVSRSIEGTPDVTAEVCKTS